MQRYTTPYYRCSDCQSHQQSHRYGSLNLYQGQVMAQPQMHSTIQNSTLSGFKCQYCNRYQQCPSGTTTVSSLGQVCPSNPTLQSERNVKKPIMILDPNTGRDLTSEILNVREGRYEIPITSPKPNGHGSKTIKTIDTDRVDHALRIPMIGDKGCHYYLVV